MSDPTRTKPTPAKPRARVSRAGKTAQARSPRAPKARAAAPRTRAGAAKTGAAAEMGAAGVLLAGRGLASAAGWSGRALGACASAAGRAAVATCRTRGVQRVVGLVAIAGALSLASLRVREQVESWPRFAVDRTQLILGAPPAGLSERVRDDIARLPLPTRPHAFDHRLVPFVAACLNDLPWVARVHDVRLSPPNQLSFDLAVRAPLAQLDAGADAPLVTRDLAIIPRAYGAHPDLLPRLLGVPGASRPLARRRALEAGAQVIEALGELALEVERVDLSNLDGRRDPLASEVLLVLRSGLAVEWGRAETSARPHRPAAEKRAALEAFLAGYAALDQVERVSVRWEETVYVLRPAAELSARTDAARTPGS